MVETVDVRKKASIVIVDDELSILKELRILLGRMYKVSVFANPVEAEAFVDEHHVDMVISDEMMPEMRGSELLARIHRKHPEICNIVLSGQAEKDDIVRAVNEGHIFSFLYKPTERQQLINVIEKGLENQHMKRVLAEQNIRLREYSENLEKMVAEKTAELVKAHARLNALDADKMSFLLYLSEELDSPLDRIQNLADALLSYFACTAAEPRVDIIRLSLRDSVEDAVRALADSARARAVVLSVDIDPELFVLADRKLLALVLTRVMDNGLVYSPEGGRVVISAGSAENRVQLRVTDDGCGIEQEDIHKVFKAFQLERARRHPHGFGLNMPLARVMMEAMDGTIRAESDGRGRGTTFVLELPGA